MNPDPTTSGSNDPLGSNGPDRCAACRDALVDLVLGELPAEKVAAVEAHCVDCASCRAERELLARSAALVAADTPKLAPLLALSEARQQSLRAAAAASGSGAGAADAAGVSTDRATVAIRPFWNRRRLAAAAAAIVVVAIGGQWLWRGYDLGGHGKTRELEPWQVARNEKGRVTFQIDDAAAAGAPVAADAGSGGMASVDGARAETRESLIDQLSTATDARDAEAARAAIAELQKQPVPLDAAQIASLSVDLAQAEQPELALELLRQAPKADTLDDVTRDKLERVSRYVEEKLPKSEATPTALSAAALRELKTLGYLSSEEAEETAATKELAAAGHSGADDSKWTRRVATSLESALEEQRQLGESLQLEVPPVGGLGQSQSILFDDSGAEASWRVFDPNAATDAFGVQLDLAAGGGDPTTFALSTFFTDAGDGDIRARPELYFDVPDPSVEATLRELGYPDDDSGGNVALARGAVADPRAQQSALAVFLANVSIVAPSDLVAFEGALGRAAAQGASVDVDAIVKSFLAKLAPQQGEAPRDMFFRWFGDNAVVPTRIDCRSTFGMDVDSASYNLARAYLAKGTLPPKAAIRTEEFVNAFRQGLAAPSTAIVEHVADGIATHSAADVFALTTELAPSPFGEGKHLLRVGLKAREIDRAARKPAVLTFVIDVSGSMNEGGRLELVKQALRLLVAQLDERDSVGIVVFSENARIALPPTRGSDRERILAALDPLRPEQSTNAGAGLRLGYDLAIAALSPDADNRVVMCSDGVANSGVTDPDQLTARIRECKNKRIALTTVGVGMNNVNDALLEQLAREGDGNCHYVDGIAEAKELFVDKLTGTLTTVARDAKIQVEFEPGAVVAFRQLGYENRALAHQDFRNDRVDAGEVGAGHEVVALYELDLAPDAAGPLATVRCRYEDPRTASVREQARICFAAEAARSAGEMGPRFRLAAAVAEFAELLRQSVHARAGSLAGVLQLAEPLVAELPDDPDVPEFVALVRQAARLPDLLPPRTAIVRCVDELKRTRCLEQELRRLDPPQQAANDSLLRQLEQQNQDLERALRDALTQAATKR
ncbi:MAG: DUF3520 domain-containing protein [Planctomycetes bacterium]|nr:DUF3520 domain-containing protein [Planctomycetota bacterium]